MPESMTATVMPSPAGDVAPATRGRPSVCRSVSTAEPSAASVASGATPVALFGSAAAAPADTVASSDIASTHGCFETSATSSLWISTASASTSGCSERMRSPCFSSAGANLGAIAGFHRDDDALSRRAGAERFLQAAVDLRLARGLREERRRHTEEDGQQGGRRSSSRKHTIKQSNHAITQSKGTARSRLASTVTPNSLQKLFLAHIISQIGILYDNIRLCCLDTFGSAKMTQTRVL